MRRLTVTRIAALVALAAGLLGGGRRRACDRADPTLRRVHRDRHTEGFNGRRHRPVPGHRSASNAPTGACFLASAHSSRPSTTWDLTQGRTLELVNGHGEFQMEEWGDICGAVFWAVGGPMVVDATADRDHASHGTAEALPTTPVSVRPRGLVEISFTGLDHRHGLGRQPVRARRRAAPRSRRHRPTPGQLDSR